MTRHALRLALAAVLSACGSSSSSSGSAVLKFHGSVGGTGLRAAASTQVSTLAVAPSTTTIFQMKMIAAYLSEDIDPATQNNVGHTPMIYLNPDCQGDIEHCDISAGTAPDGKPITHIVQSYFDFALPADQVNAALNAQAYPVQTGSYRYVRIEFCKYNSGNANNVTWGTVDTGAIEFNEGVCVVSAAISPPVSIGSGEVITITLNYDLVGTLQTGDSASGQSCTGIGATRACFTVPTFVPAATK
jgi:hypothetical protein